MTRGQLVYAIMHGDITTLRGARRDLVEAAMVEAISLMWERVQVLSENP